uniref:Phage P2 GpU n=1 Tax=Candidatus Kentrum sp. DK TaxID=2126562 RepID=A0A450TLQ1_9GAMM|nr:MAG: hypothetical protein BECKDK2373B_GA0170837_12202 [Candidatus Kentron sp. DK]
MVSASSTRYMMALGEYRFSIDTAAYRSLVRASEYRWRAQTRVGREPAQQYLGPGSESISLDGVIYPSFRGGTGQLEAMRAEASKGEALVLVAGTGHVLGRWCILSIEESQDTFLKNGVPRKVAFRLQLTRYGEDD